MQAMRSTPGSLMDTGKGRGAFLRMESVISVTRNTAKLGTQKRAFANGNRERVLVRSNRQEDPSSWWERARTKRCSLSETGSIRQ